IKWHQTAFKKRAKAMLKLSEILTAKKEVIAKVITLEMGKALKEAVAEVEKCASVCEYYAINTENFLKDQAISTDVQKNYISYQPLGVILAIMPWNFPFWQVFRF